jgi:hypothetical protein
VSQKERKTSNKFGSASHLAGTRAQKSHCNVARTFELAPSARCWMNAGRASDDRTIPAPRILLLKTVDSADQVSQSERKIWRSYLAVSFATKKTTSDLTSKSDVQ